MANEIAGEGQVFVCGACGKRSKDRFGEQSIDLGWDESCMLNAVLCHDQQKFSPEGILAWTAIGNDH